MLHYSKLAVIDSILLRSGLIPEIRCRIVCFQIVLAAQGITSSAMLSNVLMTFHAKIVHK